MVGQVGADEAGEGERAFDDVLRGLGETQQDEGDQRHGDLDPDGVLAGAHEVAQFQRLLDPAEEQFDHPAPFVEVGDFPSGGLEIVGQDAQDPAGFDLTRTSRTLPWNGFLRRLACRSGRWPIRSDRMASPCQGPPARSLSSRQRRIALEPGDDPAVRLVEGGPPAVIIVAEVEDVGGAGLDGHRLEAVRSVVRAGVTML